MHLGKRLRDDMPFEYFRFGNAEAVLHARGNAATMLLASLVLSDVVGRLRIVLRCGVPANMPLPT